MDVQNVQRLHVSNCTSTDGEDVKTKRLGLIALAMSLLATGLAVPVTAAENTPPEIHVTDLEWPNNRLIPWLDGVRALDAEDGDLTHAVTYDEKPHISDRPGDDPAVTWYFVYSVTDSAGATTTVKRYVTFIDPEGWRADNKPPVLVAGGEDRTICLGEPNDPTPGLRFDDDYDGKGLRYEDMIASHIMFGPAELGTFEHHYGITDSNWASLNFTVKVTVRDCSNDARFFLNDEWGPEANRVYPYGLTSDDVYIGDWDGDGTDTIALRRGNTFYINNGHDSTTDSVVNYGRPGDDILVGDWDGNGTDTFAVRRGKAYHVKNSLAGGNADHVILYGRADDQVLVGDWNDDGRDTFSVRRGKTYYVKNRIAGGDADHVVAYGRADDDVYVGDWDGDGKDTFAVRRGKTYYVANAIRGGDADRVLTYGRAGDTTLVGDWNGDGRDTLGVRR